MYQEDYYNPVDSNDYDDQNEDDMFERSKRQDKGYNTVYRKALRKNGKTYQKKIEMYTSNGTGSLIRDAETGEYFDYKVGSKNEDLFFKVMLATGECTSANGSYTLFYASPQHYANHMLCAVDAELALAWERKRDARFAELKIQKKQTFNTVEVR